ncbi:MAG: (Fe-S)-binding protein [Chromatiales bacterium]
MTAPEPLLEETDRCVKCGLCLPHCPTYGLSRDEGESPRGRIALIQGLATGALPGDERLWGHLDRCLGCRACEPACPSGVRFGKIIDGARDLRQASRPGWRSAPSSLLMGLLARAPRRPVTRQLLRALQQAGATGLAARLPPTALGRLARLLPALGPTHRWRPLYPGAGPGRRPRVGLFTGCVSRLAEQDALLAAVRVLQRLGVDVVVPQAQTCCGAIHQHSGRSAEARRLMARNRAAFEGRGLDAVVWVASGCGAQLAEYPELSDGALAPEPVDLCAYIRDLEWPAGLAPVALPERAAVHEPCTLRNVLHGAEAAYALLERIPGLDLIPLQGNERCCGAAGTYFLSQPGNADRLREPKVSALARLRPRYLVTTNVGCALHIGAGARQAGLDLEVVHPVQLLDRQLSAAEGPAEAL